MMRTGVGCAILLTAGVALTLVAMARPAIAQTAPLEKSFADWVLQCQEIENGLPCQIRHRIVDGSSNTQVLAFSIVYSPDNKAHGLQLVVPLDFLLERGLSLVIDAYRVDDIPVSYCETSGCIVEARLDEVAVEAFKSGETSHVHMTARDGRRIGLPFSLKGFTAAEKALRKETNKRLNQDAG